VIDDKSFIEFCEREFNVKFVDQTTGRNALEIIKEQKYQGKCQNCASALHGDGVMLHLGDIICGDDRSDHCADWVNSDYSCEFWESTE